MGGLVWAYGRKNVGPVFQNAKTTYLLTWSCQLHSHYEYSIPTAKNDVMTIRDIGYDP